MKEGLRSLYAKLVSRSNSPVVVASMGRSGSTMLAKSIAKSASIIGSLYDDKPLIRKGGGNFHGLKKRDGVIYKTHGYPPNKYRKVTKYVYIYDDPYLVVSSMYRKVRNKGDIWIKKHANNLEVKKQVTHEFLKEDCLELEKHFDSWCKFDAPNKLITSLDQVWKNKSEISKFLEFELQLPKKRKRKSSIKCLPKSKRKKVKKVYKNLKKKTTNKNFEIKCNLKI
jgi:hypothetical protein